METRNIKQEERASHSACHKVLRWLLIVILAVVVIFLTARYGWRLFGFNLCNLATSIYAEEITVTDTSVDLTGGTIDSFSSAVGYYSRQEGSNLYIGIKTNAFLGFINRNGLFRLKIDLSEPVEAIYFKDRDTERMIWNADPSKVPVQKISGTAATEDSPAACDDEP